MNFMVWFGRKKTEWTVDFKLVVGFVLVSRQTNSSTH